jgi:putative colanic acid biosynthesis UDP-glucose lipid carrier transferase
MTILKPYGGFFIALHRVLDACLIALTLWGANRALEHDWAPMLTLALAGAIVLFLVLGEARRLYASWRLGSLDDEFGNVLAIWIFTCSALIVVAFLLKVSSNYSRLVTTAWFLCTPALLMTSRLAIRGGLRWLRRHGANMRSVAVAGAGPLADRIVKQLEESQSFGVRVAGIFDDRAAGRQAADGYDISRTAGTLHDMVELARRGELDYVFIALPMRAEKRVVELANQLADTTATVYVVPDLFVFDLMRARWTTLGGLPAVSIYESPFDGVNGWLKRAEDLVVGSVLLVLTAIPMAAIALGVALTTPGSVIFRQRRYGLNGKVVRVLKFRTMNVSQDGTDVVVIPPGQQDPRVTPIGRFLRATSLDELPQLFNVLGGSMSLVGPRPHAVAVNEQYRRLIHGYMLRHKVKPGITGWAQVNGWHGDDTPEKMQKRVEHDLDYMQNWSLWLDLKILALTLLTVLSRRSAQRGETRA